MTQEKGQTQSLTQFLLALAAAAQAATTDMATSYQILAVITWSLAAIALTISFICNFTRSKTGRALGVGAMCFASASIYYIFPRGVEVKFVNKPPYVIPNVLKQTWFRAEIFNKGPITKTCALYFIKLQRNGATIINAGPLILWSSNDGSQSVNLPQTIPAGNGHYFDILYLDLNGTAGIPADRISQVWKGELQEGKYIENLSVRGDGCSGENYNFIFDISPEGKISGVKFIAATNSSIDETQYAPAPG